MPKRKDVPTGLKVINSKLTRSQGSVKMINIQHVKTKIGELVFGSFDSHLCMLDYRGRSTRATVDNRLKKGIGADFIEKNDDVLEQALTQVEQYLSGSRKEFDLPLLMVGTDFQKNVWAALMKVPYGETSTYRQVAKNIGNEKAVRAVANANGANALGLIIPCHRIIGSDGKLVGYAGGLPAKNNC